MERERRTGKARWLTGKERLLQASADLGINDAQLGNTEIPGVLTLTDQRLVFAPDPGIERTFDFILQLGLLPGRRIDAADLMDLLHWQSDVAAITDAHSEGFLGRLLVVTTAQGTQRFGIGGAGHWRRAIQDAARLLPDEGLSRAEPDDPNADRGLSREE